MARKRVKRRTHLRPDPNLDSSQRRTERPPKSMVIRIGAGEVGSSVSQLVKDVRNVMEPETAGRLKERKTNKLKDYVVMAGPLGVTHLVLFSRSPSGNTNLRLAVAPRGPTLHFRVDNYSLCKDIFKSQKHPKASPDLHLNPPLLVMNGLQTVPQDTKDPDQQATRRLESLIATLFGSLFPQISPMSTPLKSVKRVLLLNREASPDKNSKEVTLVFRHYAINTKRSGLSKAIKRINAAEKVLKTDRRGKGVPNLGSLNDVSEYVLDEKSGNYTSASESEPDTDAEVEVLAPREKRIHYKDKLEKLRAAQNGSTETPLISGSGEVEKRGIVLTELGPRMKLRLIKVEEGLCEGKIIWHGHVEKTRAEQHELEEKWETKRKEKEERRRIQKQNIERKKHAIAKGEDFVDDENYDDWEAEDFDDVDRMHQDEEDEEMENDEMEE